MTQKQKLLLCLLAVTMVSARILLHGGIFRSLRSAQRELRQLWQAGHIQRQRYSLKRAGCFQQFYSLTRTALPILLKKELNYHIINEWMVEHDSLTALFLVHLFRCSEKRNIAVSWHPPFALGDKVSDGGIVLARDGNVIHSILLETDMGTHSHCEIETKLHEYLRFLQGYPKRLVVFLVSRERRKTNLQKTINAVLQKENQMQYLKHIRIFVPPAFPKDIEIFQKRQYECQRETTEQRQQKMSSYTDVYSAPEVNEETPEQEQRNR